MQCVCLMFSLRKSLHGSDSGNISVRLSVSSLVPQHPFPHPTHSHTGGRARAHTPQDKPLAGTLIRNRVPLSRKSAARFLAGPSQQTRRRSSPRPEAEDQQLLPLRPGLPPGSGGCARAGAEAAGQSGAGLTAQAAWCSPAMSRSAAVNSWLAGCLGSPSGAPREPGAGPPQAPSEAELRVELGCCRNPSARGGGLPSAALASTGNPQAAMAPPRWEV